MHSFAYSADRSATPVAHCFSPSDLMPLVRAHSSRSEDKSLLSTHDTRTSAHSETCSPGLLFYLSADSAQAEHQIDAISRLMQELYLRSLPRVGLPGGR